MVQKALQNPQIRFKRSNGTDYPDWWGERLGDINNIHFLKGQGLSKGAIVKNGQYECILYGELFTIYKEKTDIVVSRTNEKVKVSSVKGDVLVPSSTTTKAIDLATATVIEKDNVLLSGDINVIRLDQQITHPLFVSYAIRNIWKQQIKKTAQGSTIIHLYNDNLKKLNVKIPHIDEQKCIAEFLSNLDDMILGFEQKIENLQQQKKYYMQNLFPQTDETNPKIRFKQPNGTNYPDWQSKRLGDIGDIRMCKRILKSQTSPTETIPFYKIGTFGKTPDAFISQDLYEKHKYKYSFPNKGDVLISASGTIGRTVVYDGQPAYFQDSNIVWIEHKNSMVLNQYLTHFYKIIKWYVSDGSTIKRLYNDNIRKTEILFPCINEQKRIAEFLSNLDTIITTYKQKTKTLKKQKKFYMQNMFI